ncbi:MAG: YbjN domain-containing protein [Beutenbergiaceae bacterium]
MSSPSDIPALPAIPAPVTFERVAACLPPQGSVADGEKQRIFRRWDQTVMSIWVSQGEATMLLFHATQPNRTFPLDRAAAIAAFANNWHRDRLWPTIVVVTTPEHAAMHTQLAIDIGAGLTDDQLRGQLQLVEVTIRQAMTAFNEAFEPPSPDPQSG